MIKVHRRQGFCRQCAPLGPVWYVLNIIENNPCSVEGDAGFENVTPPLRGLGLCPGLRNGGGWLRGGYEAQLMGLPWRVSRPRNCTSSGSESSMLRDSESTSLMNRALASMSGVMTTSFSWLTG